MNKSKAVSKKKNSPINILSNNKFFLKIPEDGKGLTIGVMVVIAVLLLLIFLRPYFGL
jgi:hypothetical protein